MIILSFIGGFGAMFLLSCLYLVHVERMNRHLITAVRQNERRRAYARGYEDRALIAVRAGSREQGAGSDQ